MNASHTPNLRVISYGGGVQSTALLVLAAQRRIDFLVFLFANVGHDSEDPNTLRYLQTHAAPYAERHGIELVQLHRTRRDGSVETLHGRLTRPGSRSLPIPVRMSSGAPGTRSCTADFKISVTGKWLKAHGASASSPATVGIGISLDEFWRINNRRAEPYERPVYPLLEHDPPLRRTDCEAIIRAGGLPVPGKSACWFCPLRRPSSFAVMRRDRPELFAKAAELEELLNHRRAALGRDPVWLTRFNRPLTEAVGAAQDPLPGLVDDPDDGSGCDNGACFT
jgi:hypothetical protein